MADSLNLVFVPARSVVNLGGRYRFDWQGKPATLRAQIGNIFDNYGFSVLGEGLYYNFPRRFSLGLTIDV